MNVPYAATKITPERRPLHPMGWRLSLLYFGLPALLLVGGFHAVMPWLLGQGIAPFYAYFWGITPALALLLVASLVALRQEGYPLHWTAVAKRFRLHRMNGRAWLWTLVAFVGMMAGFGLIAPLEYWLVDAGALVVPAWLPPFLDPRLGAPGLDALDAAFGGLAGNWTALFAMVVLLFFNIVGEEFWWRGVILPRQEVAFGRRAWLVHGFLWAVFHVFKWWNVLALIPVTLILSYVVVRLRNTTVGLVLHFLFNGLILIPLTIAVMGF
jgi:membrane protease YdiL (CAAX protease family)